MLTLLSVPEYLGGQNRNIAQSGNQNQNYSFWMKTNIVWRNLFLSKVELPFQWMVYKPIIPPGNVCTEESVLRESGKEERVPDLDSVFSVYPTNGILQPLETAQFKFTFAPPTVRSSFWKICFSEKWIIHKNKPFWLFLFS